MASPLTTHALDTATGKPAAGLPILLEHLGDTWERIAQGTTNADGRVADLLDPGQLVRGTWRITFDTGAYFELHGVKGFYPYVTVVFEVTEPSDHHHVPLLISPFGYSTYRGS